MKEWHWTVNPMIHIKLIKLMSGYYFKTVIHSSRWKPFGRLHNAQLDEETDGILQDFSRNHFTIDDSIEGSKTYDNVFSSCRNTHKIASMIAYLQLALKIILYSGGLPDHSPLQAMMSSPPSASGIAFWRSHLMLLNPLCNAETNALGPGYINVEKQFTGVYPRYHQGQVALPLSYHWYWEWAF